METTMSGLQGPSKVVAGTFRFKDITDTPHSQIRSSSHPIPVNDIMLRKLAAWES